MQQLACIALVMLTCPAIARAPAPMHCDATGICLQGDDAARHDAARAALAAGRAADAAELLTRLAEDRRTREADPSLLVANDLAVALARSGRRIEAALVLEDWLAGRAELDRSFDNLTRLYGALADPAADARPLDGLGLARIDRREPKLAAIARERADVARDVATTPSHEATDADQAPRGHEAASRTALSEPLSAPLPEARPEAGGQGPASALAAALEDWRSAWANGDIEAYLDAYADGQSPRAGLARDAWEQQRRARVSPQRGISVELEDIEIDLRAELAEVRFTQRYRAHSYADRTFKTLRWRLFDGRWRIVEEATR